MSRKLWFGHLLFSSLLVLAACSTTPKPPAANGGIFRQRNEAYSLLYKLMTDESDVGKIFIFKHADDSVGNLVREIGNFSQSAKKQMDDFPRSDNRIEYDLPDLPVLEQKSRDLQKDADTKGLLFSGGKDFELRLIFTQAEAMNYAVQLAKALAEDEDNPARKGFLENMAKQCADYHDRLMGLLAVKS